ncbi:MAG: PEPxxWA-CTERM sorting domain-containing protein, partial [Caulobacteraceae bacterium]
TTIVSFGDQSVSLTPAPDQPYTQEFVFFFKVSGHLSFTDSGPSDGMGNLLDDVFAETPLPEPATWTLALAGLGAVGAALRSRRKGVSTA